MNRNPLWKNLLIAWLVAAAGFYALPNVFGSDPALQISGAGVTVDASTLDLAKTKLADAKVAYTSTAATDNGFLIRFGNVEDQLRAQQTVQAVLGPDYVVALNLAPSAPAWLGGIGAQPMFLGLDLRGGVHFLMQVDMDAAKKTAEEKFAEDVRVLLRGEKVRYLSSSRSRFADGSHGILVKFRTVRDQTAAQKVIEREQPELSVADGDQDGHPALHLRLTETFERQTRESAIDQNVTTLRNRVNELGVAEPIIQRQGDSRIVVQLPGVQDTARAKEILGATATLEFKLVSEQNESALADGRPVAGARAYAYKDGGKILLKNRTILTGESITDSSSGVDSRTAGPVVFISLDGRGAKLFERITSENVGKRLAVIFIENKIEDVLGEDGKLTRRQRVAEEVITAPVIQERLGRRFQITGLDSGEEARNLALLLRAGSLAAPISIVEERTIGPSLGRENIRLGIYSVILGLVLVAVFMAFRYRAFGLIANLALAVNLVLLVALLSVIQATLTLPGIAGIVLTLGMAVDANVLIYERIREEIANGSTPQASIFTGFEKAFGTIIDSNLTTLVVGIVLFIFGTGPVKGFAVTLSLGIATSMFSAITVTRAVVNLAYGYRKVSRLSI